MVDISRFDIKNLKENPWYLNTTVKIVVFILLCSYVTYTVYLANFKQEGATVYIKSKFGEEMQIKVFLMELEQEIKEKQEKESLKKLKKSPHIYLTFDDGPSVYTLDIIKTLEKYESKGTFFFIGENLHLLDKKTKKALKNGEHSVGSHSETHNKIRLYDQGKFIEEHKNVLKKLKKEGFETNSIRAPYGSTYLTDFQVSEVKKSKMKMVDWEFKNVDKTYKHIVSQLDDHPKKGTIILMHERPETEDILEKLLPYLKKKGYEIISEEQIPMKEYIFGGR